ncbi:hypothetical protein HK097_008979 [Rhizophlyctis rosea]|uniref:Uncharacterized protein n=1 Tax=Rhizophlyctis rosea TaxID=64517 RepID=A0AAD5X3L3_9FUNG|nr:hypothetical protein HK097_008979 [Rhizophlyctis rosea]
MELEYRSSILDILFSSLLEDKWLNYRPGEQHNTLMATDRAVQQQDETARGRFDDGIGWALFDNLKVPLLLMEVVGGLATSVSVQTVLAKDQEVVLEKLRAVGLLTWQTRLRVFEARFVEGFVVVKIVDDVGVPGSIHDWRELGRLMERLVYVKYSLHRTYEALKSCTKQYTSLPASLMAVTPGKDLKRKGSGSKKGKRET